MGKGDDGRPKKKDIHIGANIDFHAAVVAAGEDGARRAGKEWMDRLQEDLGRQIREAVHKLMKEISEKTGMEYGGSEWAEYYHDEPDKKIGGGYASPQE